MLRLYQRDYEALLSIYKYRCLSQNQLFRMHYAGVEGEERTTAYFRKKLTVFRSAEYIRNIVCPDPNVPPLIELTKSGIRAVKQHFRICAASSGMPPYNAIDVEPRHIHVNEAGVPHQYFLNCFALNVLRVFSQVPGIQYFDEKQIRLSDNIRPDGVIIIPQFKGTINGKEVTIPKTNLLLEVDMGTESSNRIITKMTRYRQYLNSSKVDADQRNVIVFISYDRSLPNSVYEDSSILASYNESWHLKRRNISIRKAIYGSLIDMLGPNIEVLVGTQPRLIAALKCLYLHEYLGAENNFYKNAETALFNASASLFEFVDTQIIAPRTNNVVFDYYAKCTKYQKYFAFKRYFGEPMSVVHLIINHGANKAPFVERYGRDLTLVILVNREDAITSLDELVDLRFYEDVMFTTPKRLASMPINEALFRPSSRGNLHYDETFTHLIPE